MQFSVLKGLGVNVSPMTVELVLDRSGSMSGAAEAGTKLDALVKSIKEFAKVLGTTAGHKIGAVAFNHEAPADGLGSMQLDIGPLNVPNVEAWAENLKTVGPGGFTSIGAGMQMGLTALGLVTGRRVMIVFTDGLENRSPMVADPIIVVPADVELYSIAYGQTEATFNRDLVARCVKGGVFVDAMESNLPKHFLNILANTTGAALAQDPIIDLGPEEEIAVPVTLSDCDTSAKFILNWLHPTYEIGFDLIAPDGTRFTSTSVYPFIEYVHDRGYAFYSFAADWKQGGKWQMILHGGGRPEKCITMVMIDSPLKVVATVDCADSRQPLQIRASLYDSTGPQVTKATVTVTVTAPTRSLTEVSTPDVIARALNADIEPLPSTQQPLIPSVGYTHDVPFDEGVQAFVLNLPPPIVDGVYRFEFNARGEAPCGGQFQRYQSFSFYISK
jgi:hypothetical protein